MAQNQTKYSALGMEWAQVDGQREALFAFIMEMGPNKEPTIKTVALTVPNISGQGDPGQPLYAMRPLQHGGTVPQAAGPQTPPAPIAPAIERGGLTVVRPEEVVGGEQLSDAAEGIPSRRAKKTTD